MIEIMTLVLLFVLLIFFIDFSAEGSLLKFIKDFNEHGEVEQFFRNNIGSLSIIIIILLFVYGLYNNDIKSIIAPMLSVIAFWYGYDKYKRDKETDILQKNLDFKKDLLSSEISEIEKVSLIYSEFERVRDMREKGYMSEELFMLNKGELFSLIEYYMRLFVFELNEDDLVNLKNDKEKISPIIFIKHSYIFTRIINLEYEDGRHNLLGNYYKEIFFDENLISTLYKNKSLNRLGYILDLYNRAINSCIINKYELDKIVDKINNSLKDRGIPEEFHLKIDNNTNQ